MPSKKVVLKGTGIRNEEDAGVAITPGMLLTFDGSGDVIPHNVEGGTASPNFAVENDFVGNGMDVAYAVADRVQYDSLHVGQQVNSLLRAGAAAITKGDYMVSAGNGTLIGFTEISISSPTVAEDAIVGRALETVDNSGGATNVRLVLEIG